MEKNDDMRQEEFLTSFQKALTGKVSDRLIQENINYYTTYISNEVKNGKSEEEVLQMLGDPRLLAKTIEESNKFANGDESYTTENGGWSFQGNRTTQHSQEQNSNVPKTIKLPGWLIMVLVVLVLIAVLRLAFSVLSFFAPVILAGAVGLLVYRIITRNNG